MYVREGVTAVSEFVDRIKGSVKQAAGAVLGDDDLKREGELHHEKVDAAKTAKEAEKQAEQEHTEAEVITREREIEVERQRIATEVAADAREAQVEREQ